MFLRLLPYLIFGVGIIGAIGAVYWKGQSDGRAGVTIKTLEATVESEKKYEEIKHEIIKLPSPALRKRYCKWVRDSEDLCLQANIPIP